ncbi:SCP2 sterol-binding domain-containing protein [Sutcliffiella horikoshii]|uniref:SCP2 sterol-binding domain-containing protein n=1 Tax=Sutcliffiella horikoshii TaxID=79883 RepID=UPI0007D043C6|nr:SCP2 sterol-binding domain-containing protein [Sutcliffiella horikoshii]MCM3616786.1 SCP2 sterol-binding domain-containing protein [Sutcliffiella horikoshii]
MDVKSTFQELQSRMNENPEGIKGLNAVYQFNLNEDKIYQISFHEGNVEMYEREEKSPDCILELSDENVLKMIEGNFNTTMAYMTGKLKVKGDLGLALKLQSALEKYQ